MANQIYGYNTSYGVPGTLTLPSAHSTKSFSDPYNPESSLLASARYLSSFDRYSSDSSAAATAYSAAFSAMDRGSSFFINKNDSLKLPGTETGGAGLSAAANILSMASRFPSSTFTSSHFGHQANVGSLISGLKRPNEVLYHQQFLGPHNTFGQNEALLSDSLTKRLRSESTSHFIIYPQRPGERDCAHYMLTRTCKFGDSCRFDHPIWVPEGGIPDWKEVPFVEGTEVLPERPGEPSCPYYMKTQKCKYGQRCKFNHPQKTSPFVGSAADSAANLPERPSEPSCAFYMKTGKCKFGETCKFNHPKDIQSSLNGTENYDRSVNANGTSNVAVENPVVDGSIFVPPALMHNSKGLPVRQGEVDCTFYMKTGSCKFGAMCRFNHPDRVVINSPGAAISNSFLASANHNNHGVINALGPVLHASNPALTQKYLGFPSTILPQRPGEIECDYYMKTGQCKYGDRCRFHHPTDRSSSTTAMVVANPMVNEMLHPNPSVTLTPAGLPRRQEAIMCAFYLRTGTCRFGATCKFDHPPPAEVMEKAASEGHQPPDASLL